MAVLKHPVRVVMITLADNSDVTKLKNELGEHGKVIGDVFKDDKKLKGGAFLWKWEKAGTDIIYLVMITGRPSLTEAVTKEGIAGVSKRGLFDLKTFHKEYPDIPIHDIGKVIDAGEVAKAAEIIKTLQANDKEALNKLEEMQKIAKKQTGFRTRKLNVGCLITTIDEDFNTFFNELKVKAGKSELKKFRWQDLDVGLIIWHYEKAGKDEYWIFLVLDEDKLIEGKIDWEGPNIDEFSKLYGNSIPIMKFKTIKTNLALEPNTVINRLISKRDEMLKKAKK